MSVGSAGEQPSRSINNVEATIVDTTILAQARRPRDPDVPWYPMARRSYRPVAASTYPSIQGHDRRAVARHVERARERRARARRELRGHVVAGRLEPDPSLGPRR